jgi:hypothetical protein
MANDPAESDRNGFALMLAISDSAAGSTHGYKAEFHDCVARYYETLAAISWSHPRRLGLLLMQLGSLITMASLPFSVASMNIGFVTAAVGAVLARPPLHKVPGFAIGALFSGWVILSVAVNSVSGQDIRFSHCGVAYTWLALPIGAIAFYSRFARAAALSTLAVVVFLIAVLALMQFLLGYDANAGPLHLRFARNYRYNRVSGTLGGVLTYGLASIMIGLLLMSTSVAGAMPRSLAVLGRIGACAGVLLSCSRMAMCAAIVAVGTYVIAKDWRKIGVAVGIMLGLSLSACVALAVIAPRKFAEVSDGLEQRWQIWRVSSAVAADNPAFGVGGREAFVAQYEETSKLFEAGRAGNTHRSAQHAHNSELALAAEHGIPAALLHLTFLAALVVFFIRMRRREPESFRLGIVLLVAWLFAGQFNNLAGQSESVYALSICLAMVMNISVQPRPHSGGDPWLVPWIDSFLERQLERAKRFTGIGANGQEVWQASLQWRGIDLLTCVEFALTASMIFFLPCYFDTDRRILPSAGHWLAAALCALVLTVRRSAVSPYQRSLLLPLFLFAGWTVVVGLVWAVVLNNAQPLSGPMIYCSGAMVVSALVMLANRHGKTFLHLIFISLVASVLCQWVLTLGVIPLSQRRNQLLFDNPNQLGLFVIITGVTILAYGKVLGKIPMLAAVLLTVPSIVLIQMSQSRGAMVAALCAMAAIVLLLSNRGRLIYAGLIALGMCAVMIYSDNHWVIKTWYRWHWTGKGKYDSFENRGYDRIVRFPEYLLAGAGEGKYSRFEPLKPRELHSTVGTVLFSYGAIGTILLAIFIYRLARPNGKRALFVLLPILTYGITHHALRSADLWLLLAALAILQSRDQEGKMCALMDSNHRPTD